MNQQLFADVDTYIANLFAPEDAALTTTLHNNHSAGLPAADVSAVQGKLLQVFAHMCNARHILELGTLGGYSTIWLARALPAGGKVITLEISPHNVAIAQANINAAGVTDKVEIRIGKALDTLAQLHTENLPPFDMVFMDADKPPYAEYLQWAIAHSRPGTIIVADNVIREGKVLDANSQDPAVKGVQRFNKVLAETPGLTSVVIQTIGAKPHDGMAIAVVR